jgi:hypothetical protein
MDTTAATLPKQETTLPTTRNRKVYMQATAAGPPPSLSICCRRGLCAFLLHGLCICLSQLCLCLIEQSSNRFFCAQSPGFLPFPDLVQHQPRRCVLQDVLQAAPSLRQKRTIRTVISLDEGVDQVLLLDLFGDRFGSQISWVLKVVQVAAPEARKRVISTQAQCKQTGEKTRGCGTKSCRRRTCSPGP